MSQAQLLAEAVSALNAAGVGYVLTGSLVSSLQGEPRATHDVDIVIEVDFRAIDFWTLTDSGFDQSRFERRIPTDAFGPTVFVTTPEDTILQKLKWARDSGGSERQLRDAVGVYELQGSALDQAYLDGWSHRLELVELLAHVRALAVDA